MPEADGDNPKNFYPEVAPPSDGFFLKGRARWTGA